MSKNYYDILGVSKDADESKIKSAYRKLCLKYHPDKLAKKSEKEKQEGEAKFKEINEAYQILSDPDKKKQYDTFGTVDDMGSGMVLIIWMIYFLCFLVCMGLVVIVALEIVNNLKFKRVQVLK